MKLLPPDRLEVDEDLLAKIDRDVSSIYRLIVFSDVHKTTDLLTRYQEAVQHLREVLSIKNAQQEAQSEDEAREYLGHLKDCMKVIIREIGEQRSLEGPLDLFRLLRVIAPEAAARHPQGYRRSLVQFGRCLAPPPAQVQGLVEDLFVRMADIRHPVVRAAYLHHELVRIHPFVDGNGRVSRMAKNWLMMYELYPPIFIYGGADHARYIAGLQESSLALEREPGVFNAMTREFFNDELRRTKASTGFILNRMRNNPDLPFGPEDMDATPFRQ